MARGAVQQVIEELLESEVQLTTRGVADRAGVSRQAAQKQLRALVCSGVLSVEGKARAARYTKADDQLRALKAKVSSLAELLRPTVDVSRPVNVGPVDDSPLPPPRPTVGDSYRGALRGAPLRATLAVAETGSLYRLSARLLLCDVAADQVVFDFNGVMEASDEFLEELFVRWAGANPAVRVFAANVPDALAQRLARYLPPQSWVAPRSESSN